MHTADELDKQLTVEENHGYSRHETVLPQKKYETE